MNEKKIKAKWQNRIPILPAMFSLFLLLPVSVYSQTHVGGSVSGEWFEDYTPYIVDSPLIIEGNSQLIINPGVEVIFTGEDSLLVLGNLIANGDPYLPITFSLADTVEKHWKGISFINYFSSESEMQYCRVSGSLYGIMCTLASPTIENCRIEAVYMGISANMSYPVIKNDTILVNYYDSTPGVIMGIKLDQSPIRIENCIIEVNNYTSLGDITAFGVHANESSIGLIRNRITVWAKCQPVGVYLSHSSKDSVIYNEIIVSSQAQYTRGGLIHNESVTGFIANNTIVVEGPGKDITLQFQNSSYLSQVFNNILKGDSSSWGIHCFESYPDTIQYNDLWAHSSPTNAACPTLDFTNFYLDPEFQYLPPNNLYYLTSRSPCIDNGNPDPFFIDPDGTNGDVGAHYYDQFVTGLDPVLSALSSYELVKCYPNPTNGAVNIGFDISLSGSVNIRAFDILGRQVKVIYNGELIEGRYLYNWDMSSLSSGVYNVIIDTPQANYTRQVLLVK